MHLDAERLTEDRLEADLCIVGAGPAGIALAREFMPDGISVLLLESGGPSPEIWPQTLNQGTVTGVSYAGLRSTRHRQSGGTTHLWNTPVAGRQGAKYVPLDPWDLEDWPLTWEELVSYYHRAQQVAGLGPFLYDGAAWADTKDQSVIGLSGEHLVTRVYQFGSREAVVGSLEAIRAATAIRLCHHATVCRLSTSGDGARVTGARIRSRSGREIGVHASRFVLASGAIENARLLMVSGIGSRLDLVGRCFMEHPRDQTMTLFPDGPDAFERLAFYDQHLTPGGTIVGGRLGPTEAAVREFRLTGFSATLLPRRREPPPASGWGTRLSRRIRALVAPPPAGGYGWSRGSDHRRWFDGFRMLLNLEQRPHRENRLVLEGGTDSLGVPRVGLRWTWRPEEQAALERLRLLLVAWCAQAGLGRVILEASLPPDPNAHHHAGTTRMSRDPRDGVVDPDGRVHGVENLFVTGASVFPTAGFANPTLTVLAMAIRLADHLRGAGPVSSPPHP
jgi:choline dehydrogenase-like flavoprotein